MGLVLAFRRNVRREVDQVDTHPNGAAMTTERGTVLTLVLDAVDPRLDGEQRADAAATAIHIDPLLSGSMWAALLYATLAGVHDHLGPAVTDQNMQALASIAMSVVDMDAAGPDCGMG